MVEFFERCKVHSSNFDESFAKYNVEWIMLERCYHRATLRKSTDIKIPNLIHYIWIGGPIPKVYLDNINDWQSKNPKFETMIWDDSKIESFLKDFETYDLYKNATNVGMKSDIARYHILYRYGGIYMDTDFLCLSGDFDRLNEAHSFYTGLSYDKDVCFFNGFFACREKHPIINACIKSLKINGYEHITCEQTRTLYQTGPMFFTKHILEYLDDNKFEDFLPMPSGFLYPFPAIYREHPSEELVKSFIKPWSIACHMWHSSWSPNSMFYKGN